MSENTTTVDTPSAGDGSTPFRPWEGARPRSVDRAYSIALAQILLAVIGLVVALGDVRDVADALSDAGILSGPDGGAAVAFLVGAFAVGNLPWLWLASRMLHGANWARTTMTVINAFAAANLLFALPTGDLTTILFALVGSALAIAGVATMYGEDTARWFRRS